jgi:hypothetical protein
MGAGWQVLWLVCGLATVVAAVLADGRPWARYLGRASVGVLFIVGGALAHVVNLASGADYAAFADPAWFGWVTQAWHAVVVPNQTLYIGLLALFEATAGALVVSGGRRTQAGMVAVIAFYLALWLFGWIETVWCLVMIPAMVLLVRAERRAAAVAAPAGGGAEPRQRVGS